MATSSPTRTHFVFCKKRKRKLHSICERQSFRGFWNQSQVERFEWDLRWQRIMLKTDFIASKDVFVLKVFVLVDLPRIFWDDLCGLKLRLAIAYL